MSAAAAAIPVVEGHPAAWSDRRPRLVRLRSHDDFGLFVRSSSSSQPASAGRVQPFVAGHCPSDLTHPAASWRLVRAVGDGAAASWTADPHLSWQAGLDPGDALPHN